MKEIVREETAECEADVWISRGQGGKWVRKHSAPRLALFTPHRVPKGPPKGQRLAMRRRTIGSFVGGGAFDVTDDWTSGSQAHRFLRDAWVGRLEFEVHTQRGLVSALL